MSGLARLLAGRVDPGVYHWTSAAGIADIRHAVDHANWRFILLDTWGSDDKAGFMQAAHEAFELPEWFGRNFDALGDALSDVEPGEEQHGIVVVWDGWGPLARAQRRVFDVAVDVFSARVEYERAGPFAVLLRGPGPDDTALVELDPHGPPTG
jgi:RNAse (barnase) inhibitor barstar